MADEEPHSEIDVATILRPVEKSLRYRASPIPNLRRFLAGLQHTGQLVMSDQLMTRPYTRTDENTALLCRSKTAARLPF